MFGNVGSLPIAVISALCEVPPLNKLIPDVDKCHSKGVSYIALFIMTQVTPSQCLMLARLAESLVHTEYLHVLVGLGHPSNPGA